MLIIKETAKKLQKKQLIQHVTQVASIFPAKFQSRSDCRAVQWREAMDLGPLKQFVLWRGEKRIVMGEEDLQISKISSVFKVSSHIPLPFDNDGLRCLPLSTNSPTFYTHRAALARFVFLLSFASIYYMWLTSLKNGSW